MACIEPAAFRRLCVETSGAQEYSATMEPAAFRRLCVETYQWRLNRRLSMRQPPSGGCVLKHTYSFDPGINSHQPPSGGCVLKHCYFSLATHIGGPAAFRRLCVETCKHGHDDLLDRGIAQPPSGGCVLKRANCNPTFTRRSSRLQAAVC